MWKSFWMGRKLITLIISQHQATTSEDGSYTLEKIRAGTYTLEG